MTDPQQIVVKFNDCINTHDIDGLTDLMSLDHMFIDSAGNTERGKEACLNAWRGFFQQFPDYKNVFTSVAVRDDHATIAGYSTCADERLAGPALWTAIVQHGQVAEWRVHDDTAENRQQLGIEPHDF